MKVKLNVNYIIFLYLKRKNLHDLSKRVILFLARTSPAERSPKQENHYHIMVRIAMRIHL